MKVGDLVKLHGSNWIGIIIEFITIYDTFGDPRDRAAIVCWGADYPEAQEHIDDLEVINESR
jgi:hypothetical protein